jgi:hypothetical protein
MFRICLGMQSGTNTPRTHLVSVGGSGVVEHVVRLVQPDAGVGVRDSIVSKGLLCECYEPPSTCEGLGVDGRGRIRDESGGLDLC